MTTPELPVWPPTDQDFARSEVSVVIGRGEDLWERASREILQWRVKTACGFAVDATGPVRPGDEVTVTVRILGRTVIEPVEVLSVVRDSARVGFSYRKLPGHPVSGEEAFILHREGDEVRLSIRSLTQAAPQQPWRAVYPFLKIAQRIVRRRYLRSLR